MNIEKALLNEHSKRVTNQIIEYVGDNKIRFKELINCLFSNDKILSQRASWPIGYIGVNYPELVKPYLKKMIFDLNNPNLHDAIKRSTLRILESIEIPTKYLAPVFDLCLKFISSEYYSTGIRAFSITTATHICKKVPELKSELKLVLNALLEEPQKPAVKFRLKQSLKQL